MHWLIAILAAFAYRELLSIDTSMAVADGEWAFNPSDTAPGLVLALGAWLVFRRLGRFGALPSGPGPIWLWAPLLLSAGLAYVWATLAATPDLLAPSLALAGLAYACLEKGAPGVRVMALPASFLLFAVPLPAPILNDIVFRLQIWSAEYAGWILFLLGVPALVEGELVAQVGEAFKVIETCSGFRSIVTLMMLSIVLCDLFRRPPRHTLAMLALAPGVGFLLNGFRVTALILNPHSAIAEVHDLQGVAILLGGLVILYGLDGLLARLLRSDAVAADAPAAPPPAAAPTAGWRRLVIPGFLCAAFAVSLLLPPFQPWERSLHVAPFHSLEEPAHDWYPERRDIDSVFLGSTGYFHHTHQRFSRGEESVDLFVAIGDHEQRRMRSVFSPKTGVPGSGWTIRDERDVKIEPDGPHVRQRVVQSGKNLRLVHHWYGGALGPVRESARALLGLDHGPFPRRADPYAIRLSTQIDGSGQEALVDAQDRLAEFYRAMRTRLQELDRQLQGSQPN